MGVALLLDLIEEISLVKEVRGVFDLLVLKEAEVLLIFKQVRLFVKMFDFFLFSVLEVEATFRLEWRC